MWRSKFPYIRQLDSMDCGPSCVRMIAAFYGKTFSQQQLNELTVLQRDGMSLHNVSKLAEKVGFRTLLARIDFDKLAGRAPLPLIAHWNQNHYVVVYRINGNKVTVADPEQGLITYSRDEFCDGWAHASRNGKSEGVVLLMEPTHELLDGDNQPEPVDKASFRFLFRYLRQYRFYIIQIIMGLLIGSTFQLIFPFLTQAIVDKGIGNRDLHFIYIILIAQMVFYISNTVVGFIRAWILIHVSSRINIYIISDFLIKLMRLPIRFFDSRLTGDLMQRIRDHRRIEEFITDSLLKSLFAVFSILVCSIILAYFSLKIFLIFFLFTVIELSWIFFFLKRIRTVDNQYFSVLAQDQSKLMEIINGMQEIKLNNIEQRKRWEWEGLQASLFSVNIKKLRLNQWQDGGSRFLGYVQYVLILFFSSLGVLQGSISIGTMMAIIFIIGELNTPISQLINFIISAQYARISLERLNEIHKKDDEETLVNNSKNQQLPEKKSITIRDVSFSYLGAEGQPVLEDINLRIPEGKVTAIVGSSGSGKTTLLKLLLKFYEPVNGSITVGDQLLENIHSNTWRQNCGTVMQESFIFSDTIANNIALEDPVNHERLIEAVTIANIREFIESLPMDYNTRIGAEGVGLSQGQRQRILLARAVYKNPEYLYFDEATNALDANNERIIMQNLEKFFAGKTVLIVAHRLSTVKNAHQIVVLEKGRIVECGRHDELVTNKSRYYQLIKNQLELGM